MRTATRKEFSDALKALPTRVRTEYVDTGVVEYWAKGEPDRLIGLYVAVGSMALRYLATAAEPR